MKIRVTLRGGKGYGRYNFLPVVGNIPCFFVFICNLMFSSPVFKNHGGLCSRGTQGVGHAQI